MATPTDLGGYEYKFVKDPPDTLVCKICHHPCRVPYLTGLDVVVCHGKIGLGKTGPAGPILDAKTGPAGPN